MKLTTILAAASLTLMMGATASAKQLEGNVIVRHNSQTGVTEQLVVDQKITSEAQARELAQTGNFEPIDGNVALSELDREAGASSWYWYCPGISYGNVWATTPQYYWYGYSYNPWYSYTYSNWNYFYYGHSRWRYGWNR